MNLDLCRLEFCNRLPGERDTTSRTWPTTADLLPIRPPPPLQRLGPRAGSAGLGDGLPACDVEKRDSQPARSCAVWCPVFPCGCPTPRCTQFTQCCRANAGASLVGSPHPHSAVGSVDSKSLQVNLAWGPCFCPTLTGQVPGSRDGVRDSLHPSPGSLP